MTTISSDRRPADGRAQFDILQPPAGIPTEQEKAYLLSAVIPARNEEACLSATLEGLLAAFESAGLRLQIIVIDDHSTDGTMRVAQEWEARKDNIRVVSNMDGPGFGSAVRYGLKTVDGDGIAIVMADGSDDPDDVIAYSRLLAGGWDCVFGSRFIEGSCVQHYPLPRLLLNRMGNLWLRWVTGVCYNDFTNAFKGYRTDVLDEIGCLKAQDFALTVELPMKTIAWGCRHAVIPIHWHGRRQGASKWRLVRHTCSYVRRAIMAGRKSE